MDLSARHSETTLLTEPGCPIANFAAIQSLLTAVCVLSRVASCALRSSHFLSAFNPDSVLPIVGRNKVAARVAQQRGCEFADERGHILTESIGVGGRMTRLEDARINTPAQVLNEAAEEPLIDSMQDMPGINRTRAGFHRCKK